MSPLTEILMILRDLLKDGPEFNRKRMVRGYELAELLEERQKNLVNEIASLALSLTGPPREGITDRTVFTGQGQATGDFGFQKPVTGASVRGS